MQIQRKGIDHDPVAPWCWATMVGRGEPVEILSYPIPAEGKSEIDNDATIMVRLTIGDCRTLTEVPFKSVACFDKSRADLELQEKYTCICLPLPEPPNDDYPMHGE